MSTILITGANGFVGRALCANMLSEGSRIRGTFRSLKKSQGLLSSLEAVQIETIDEKTDWSEALDGVESIVHLAARAHVMKETSADPLDEFRRVNFRGTERLAHMAGRAGVRRFVYISSIGVNGEQTFTEPFTEIDVPHPTRPYARSKWEAEMVLREIAADTGMEVVILRPPLVYGPGAKGNMFKLMDYVYRQWPLPFGDIHNQRSFIGLNNLVDAIVVSIKRPEAAGQTFLVSDGEDISTTGLIRLIAGYMGKKAKLFNVPHSFFTLSSRLFPPIRQKLVQLTGSLVVNSGKFRTTMHWTSPCALNDGIKDMVSDYLSRSQDLAC